MRRLLAAACVISVASAFVAAAAAPPPSPPPTVPPSDWSQQFVGTWTWNGATAHAAGLVEGGYSDWRLATRAEWAAAIASGTSPVGPLQPNIGPNNYFWTADEQGPRAWMIMIATDASGSVIPSQSGATLKVLKGSATYAVAART